MTAGTRRYVPDHLFGGRLAGCSFLDLEVAEVVDHSPRLRSITFTSPDLIDFRWRPGQDLMLDVPGAEAGIRRRYTIRRSDPDAGTLDIDVVLHGTGAFAAWAATATPGARIEGIGPRGTIEVRSGAPHHLFVGDESAIAVTYSLLEALPVGARATAILGTEGEPPGLSAPDSPAALDLRWVHVGGLVEGLRDVPLPAGIAAYVHGERLLVREVTRRLTAGGLGPDAVTSKAYWRRDQANAPHGEPAKG